MSRTINISCDMCGRVLRGKVKAAWTEEPHIGFRGTFVLQRAPGDHVFVTRNPEDEMHFCDFRCLEEYADMRAQRFDQMQERRLRDEARGGGRC